MKKTSFIKVFLLLAFSAIHAEAESFSATTGISATNIYEDSNGKIKLTEENLSIKFKTERNKDITFSFDAFHLESTFAQCTTRLNSFFLGNTIEAERFKFFWTFGIMGADEINVVYQGNEYKTCGNSIKVIGLSPEYTGDVFFVKPIFFYVHADTSKNNSSFYWFNGWIRINSAILAGINAGYGNFETMVAGAKIDLDINNSDSENLASSRPFILAATAAYNFLPREKNFSFKPFAGGLYLNGEFKAMLTSQNQGYFFFPYRYYEGSGNINASIFFAGTQFNYEKKHFTLKSDLIFAYVVSQAGSWEASYRQKTNFMFNGESGTNSGDLGFFNRSGIFLLNIDANYRLNISRKRNRAIEFGIRKLFFVPFGKNPFKEDQEDVTFLPPAMPTPSIPQDSPSDSVQPVEPSNPPQPEPGQQQIPVHNEDGDSGFSMDWDLVKGYLASGLTFYVRIHF